MNAEEWAALLEEPASTGGPLSKAEARELAAFLRDVPARIERLEQIVDDLRERVV